MDQFYCKASDACRCCHIRPSVKTILLSNGTLRLHNIRKYYKNERLTQLKEKSVFTSINYLILELLLNMLYWTKTEVFY